MKQFIEVANSVLNPEMRQEFQALPTKQKVSVFMGWLRQARAQSLSNRHLDSGWGSGIIPEQELADYFVHELGEDDKARLLALPRDEMLVQLRRLYFAQSHRRWQRGSTDWDDSPPHPRGGPPPDGMRGNRRKDRRGPPLRGEPRFDSEQDRHPPRRRFDRESPRRRRPDDDRRPEDHRPFDEPSSSE